LAVIATGVANSTCCQPLCDSPENVAVASWVPSVFHRLPTCVPLFDTLL